MLAYIEEQNGLADDIILLFFEISALLRHVLVRGPRIFFRGKTSLYIFGRRQSFFGFDIAMLITEDFGLFIYLNRDSYFIDKPISITPV